MLWLLIHIHRFITAKFFPGENKLSRFEQNRFYGNSLPRGRPSRDRPSCEVLSSPPLSCDTLTRLYLNY